MTEIKIPIDLVNQFNNHAERDYPHECCGFLLGRFNGNFTIADQYIESSNSINENQERRFLIDPKAYQSAEDEADRLDKSIVGIVHSHPDHPDEPSEFDRAHAWPGFSYIIISIRKGKMKSYRSWQLAEDRTKFIEEKIQIKGVF